MQLIDVGGNPVAAEWQRSTTTAAENPCGGSGGSETSDTSLRARAGSAVPGVAPPPPPPPPRPRREPSWSEVWDFIDAHPGGAMLDEIAMLFGGVSREGIRKIERDAIRKIARRGANMGLFVRRPDGRITPGAFVFDRGDGEADYGDGEEP
jgi:hypothetical protein